MPIYEYECPDCNKVIEVLQKFSDDPLCTCPECGGGQVHKVMSLGSFHLKGQGWYVTDYSGKNSSSLKADKPEGSGEAPAKAEAKKETKTESKACVLLRINSTSL